MRVIQSIGVLSVAKITALIHATIGLIFMPFFILAFAIGAATGGKTTPFSGAFAIIFAVMAPVFYGAMGFVMGAIGAALYNVFAKWVGGIEVNVGTTSPAPYPLQVG